MGCVMEALAKKLRKEIDMICIGFHYYKKVDVIEKAVKLAEDIQVYTATFLQGNVFGMEQDEYVGLQNYVMQVLEDYIEAIHHRDMVLMLDTLDYGLRELLMIYIDVAEDTDE